MMPGKVDEGLDATLEKINMILEESDDTLESHCFTIDHWCVVVGAEEIKGRQIKNYIIEKKDTTLYHDNDQYLVHFLLSDAEMEEKFNNLLFHRIIKGLKDKNMI
jgi:hypothetical protein